MDVARAYVESISPEIEMRSLSSQYDCVGLVFASRRTAIGTESLQMILNDDGYRLVRKEQVKRGDLVVYRKQQAREITHLAIVWRIEINIVDVTRQFHCLSQWGEDGEYFHPEDAVSPWFGTYREYWAERIPGAGGAL